MEHTRYPVASEGNSSDAFRQFLGKDSRIAGFFAAPRRSEWLSATIAKAFAAVSRRGSGPRA